MLLSPARTGFPWEIPPAEPREMALAPELTRRGRPKGLERELIQTRALELTPRWAWKRTLAG